MSEEIPYNPDNKNAANKQSKKTSLIQMDSMRMIYIYIKSESGRRRENIPPTYPN